MLLCEEALDIPKGLAKCFFRVAGGGLLLGLLLGLVSLLRQIELHVSLRRRGHRGDERHSYVRMSSL